MCKNDTFMAQVYFIFHIPLHLRAKLSVQTFKKILNFPWVQTNV